MTKIITDLIHHRMAADGAKLTFIRKQQTRRSKE
jgi:hypothetical protein